MFNKNNNFNIATNGAVAAANINGNVSIQNININLCNIDDIMNMTLNSVPCNWKYNDEEGSYTYCQDIALKISENRTAEPAQFIENWVKRYADHNAYKTSFSLSYNGNKIEIFHFVSVDGARMLIPYPFSQVDLRISFEQYLLGKIINYPWCENYSFDDYLKRAHIKIDEKI